MSALAGGCVRAEDDPSAITLEERSDVGGVSGDPDAEFIRVDCPLVLAHDIGIGADRETDEVSRRVLAPLGPELLQ